MLLSSIVGGVYGIGCTLYYADSWCPVAGDCLGAPKEQSLGTNQNYKNTKRNMVWDLFDLGVWDLGFGILFDLGFCLIWDFV